MGGKFLRAPTRADNVITFEKAQKINAKIDKELAEERAERTEAFDALYADYLDARARMTRPGKTDDEVHRVADKMDEIMWRIIHTPAEKGYQINYKFKIMRDTMTDDFVDKRNRAMLESICNDVLDQE